MAACAAFSTFAMRGVRATEIGTRIKMTWIVVVLRAGLTVAVVLAVTEAAALIGPQWSGLVAGFPVTLFPVLVIFHLNYSAEDTYSILKSFPFGIPSLVIFALCSQYSFEAFGVVPDFLFSIAVSLLWQAGFSYSNGVGRPACDPNDVLDLRHAIKCPERWRSERIAAISPPLGWSAP